MRHARRWAARLLALVALAGAGFAIYYVIKQTQKPHDCANEAFPTKEFRKDVRRLKAGKDPEGKLEPRARELARQAVECEEVVGRNEPSLRALLGKPSRRKSVATRTPHENWTWTVGIGKPRPVLLVQVVSGQASYAQAPGADDGDEPVSRGTPVDQESND
jgi:hypothetical protein